MTFQQFQIVFDALIIYSLLFIGIYIYRHHGKN